MEALYYIAAALDEQGDLDEALMAYEELLPIYPNPCMVALRIDGIKGIIQKKAAPAPSENNMGLGSTEGGLMEGSGDENGPPAVGDNEKPDGIVIKTPEKKKETTDTSTTTPDTGK